MSYPAVQKNPNREVEYTDFSGVLNEEREYICGSSRTRGGTSPQVIKEK